MKYRDRTDFLIRFFCAFDFLNPIYIYLFKSVLQIWVYVLQIWDYPGLHSKYICFRMKKKCKVL